MQKVSVVGRRRDHVLVEEVKVCLHDQQTDVAGGIAFKVVTLSVCIRITYRYPVRYGKL